MAKKTAKQFSRKEVWEVATRYATSKYSHNDFEEEYQSSRSSFYTVLDRAVIENIVDSDTVGLMEARAKYNSEVKAGKPGEIRSEKHYSYLKKKRKEYMLSKEEAIKITITYAESPYSKKQFCRRIHISEQLLDRTIYKSIIDNWVSDEVVMLLKVKSLKLNGGEATIKFWEQLKSYREYNANRG